MCDRYNNGFTRNRCIGRFLGWCPWSKKLHPLNCPCHFQTPVCALQMVPLSSCPLGYRLAAPGWATWSSCYWSLYRCLFLSPAGTSVLGWLRKVPLWCGAAPPKLALDLPTVRGSVQLTHVGTWTMTTTLCVESDHNDAKCVCGKKLGKYYMRVYWI